MRRRFEKVKKQKGLPASYDLRFPATPVYWLAMSAFYLKIPNGFPIGRKGLPKCVFRTTADAA